ncbi:hypothetical protein RJ641_034615, partial [Dillenia turbinata]
MVTLLTKQELLEQISLLVGVNSMPTLDSWHQDQAADINGDGTIDFTKFIATAMHHHKLERDEILHKAFQYFDKDNS